MGLLSLFKRTEAAGAGVASEPPDAVQQARTRARQRLIGAAVLVVVGVIGFPLVFETQPRPVPIDVPIEIPRREAAPPLAMPAARAPVTPVPGRSASTPVAPASAAAIVGEAADRETAVPPVAAAPAALAEPRSPPVEPADEPPKAPAKPDARGEPQGGEARSDGARALALLNARPASAPLPADSGRFVVQVGAFADAAAARETRRKVERIGLKTYTQAASTPAGERIRVRVGPFSSREEADKAMAKAKGAGISAVVLAL